MKTLTLSTIRIFWRETSKYKISLALMLISLIAVPAFDIYVPFWYKRFFDTLADGTPGAANILFSILGIIVFLKSIEWVFRRLGGYAIIYQQPHVIKNLKSLCYEYLQKHSYNFFNNNFTGSLVRKVNKYAQSYEAVSDLLYFNIGRAAVYITILVIVLFVYYWQIGLAVFIWAIFYISINYAFSRYKYKYDVQRTEMDTKTTGHLADTITNSINLKLFSSLKEELRTYKLLNEKLRSLTYYTWKLRTHADAIQGVFMIVLEFGVFYLAIRFWQQGSITIGDFVLLQTYVVQIFLHLWGLGRYIQRLYEKFSDAEEMSIVLSTPHEVTDAPQAKKFITSHGSIVFNRVVFGYPNQKSVFRNFSLEINSGERVALIGPSGGGKSTFVKLLLRFFNIQKGEILIDGQNIAEVTLESLRNNIGLVPQDPILFHRTLMENILYGKRSATNDEVIRVAKLAHCHEFISRFPDQYQTYVGERGLKLSGGERQRVAIARAMLENASILVLDEATSSLDSESEMFIQDALEKLMRGKTTIVIAHRLSTIMKMDRIVVIENGKITEQGTHEELLKFKQGTYQKLWGIQAGGFTG